METLENEILAAGGYDPDLANRVIEHERSLIGARGVEDTGAIAELAELALGDPQRRRAAIEELRTRDPDKFVDIRRVPKAQRSNPHALLKEALRQRERDAQLQKRVTRLAASKSKPYLGARSA